MKFGKYWKKCNEELPQKLQQKLISYKKWKKMCIQNNNILQDLMVECTLASNTIIENIKTKSNLSCFFSHSNSIDKAQLYQYALLNKQTLYKICKRLDKKFHSVQYKQWLQMHYNDFAFNGGMYYTKLSLENESRGSLDECPICLENVDGNVPFIITNCGHMICYQCTILMYNITPTYRGRLSVLIDRRNIDNDHSRCCPVCRSHTFMDHIKYANIWPPACKQILDKIDHIQKDAT
jgi:hypothetical protein